MIDTTSSTAASAPVLVADDDGAVRTMVRTLLELDGHHVIEAVDGHQAWELVRERRPAVVIADVRMRGFSGLELCRLVKANGMASIRVLVYTAGMANEDESRLAGCDAYFLKTEPPGRLRDAVRQYATPA